MSQSLRVLSILSVLCLGIVSLPSFENGQAFARNRCRNRCNCCECAPTCCAPQVCAPNCCAPGYATTAAPYAAAPAVPPAPQLPLAADVPAPRRQASPPAPAAPPKPAPTPTVKPADPAPKTAAPAPTPAPAPQAPAAAPKPTASQPPVPATPAVSLAPPKIATEPGFHSLFNGKDLAGWDGLPGYWTVEDGAITGRTFDDPKRKLTFNTFLVWKDGEVDDFELRFSYRIVGGNSGVQYRSKLIDPAKFIVGGYQADIDSKDKYSALLYEERGRAILAERGTKVTLQKDGKTKVTEKLGDPAELQKRIKKEQWNEYVVIAKGNRLEHYINGAKMTEFVDDDEKGRAFKGVLALQIHQGPPMLVQFANVRMKRAKLTAGMKKVVLIAGRPSHSAGEHEFNAGCTLLRKCLDQIPGIVTAQYGQGWPADRTAFDNADSLVFFMDGGSAHPMIQGDRLIGLNKLMQQGMGLACLHYAVEVPADRGGPEFLEWIGGYFEMNWSVNPHWTAKFTKLPEHPITRGVKPFEINDEWYYHMRFRKDMDGITPILTDIPPKETLSRPDGPHSGNPDVRKEQGKPQHVAWAVQRADGGRGFGFTGGHFHKNWGSDDFRKIVLNAIVWTTRAEVPAAGIQCSVTPEELASNLDPKVRRKK